VSGLRTVDIQIVTDAQVGTCDFRLTQGSNMVSSTNAKTFGDLKSFAGRDPVVISDWI